MGRRSVRWHTYDRLRIQYWYFTRWILWPTPSHDLMIYHMAHPASDTPASRIYIGTEYHMPIYHMPYVMVGTPSYPMPHTTPTHIGTRYIMHHIGHPPPSMSHITPLTASKLSALASASVYPYPYTHPYAYAMPSMPSPSSS